MIAFEGIIGSGKTTLAKELASRAGVQALEEDLSGCPFLADFYQDPVRYAPQTEFSFLLLHYHQLLKATTLETSVADFTLAKDVVFARCNLKSAFLPTFENLYVLLSAALPKPEVCFYLRIDPKLAHERIRVRAREVEASMPVEYLSRLSSFYDEHLTGLLPKVVPIDVEATDSVNELLRKIEPNLSAHFL